MDCHFLLQCMKVKSKSEVAQSCPTLSNCMDCSPPGFSVHGIFQARALEWGAIAFSVKMVHIKKKKVFKTNKQTKLPIQAALSEFLENLFLDPTSGV